MSSEDLSAPAVPFRAVEDEALAAALSGAAMNCNGKCCLSSCLGFCLRK